jgi:hypothetical protein
MTGVVGGIMGDWNGSHWSTAGLRNSKPTKQDENENDDENQT